MNHEECELCTQDGKFLKPVQGEGPVDAKVMVVNSFTDATDQARGRPLVGRPAKIFNRALEMVGIDRMDLYITNLVKHRIPKERTKKKTKYYQREINQCLPYLHKEIEEVNPELILVLGKEAVKAFFGKGAIGAKRGRFWEWEGPDGVTRLVMVSFNPSAFYGNSPYWNVFLGDLRKVGRYMEGEVFHSEVTQVEVVTTLQEVLKMFETLTQQAKDNDGVICWDCETTGFKHKRHEILCFSFCAEKGKAFVLPIWDVTHKIFDEKKERIVWSLIYKFFTSEDNRFITWNGAFDYCFLIEELSKRGHDAEETMLKLLDRWFADMMIIHHLLEEEFAHDLEFVAAVHTTMLPWNVEMEAFKAEMDIQSYKEIPGKILWPYAGGDVDAPIRMYESFFQRIADEDLVDFYFDHQHRIAKVLTKMRYRGVYVNRDQAYALRESCLEKQKALHERIQELLGVEINLNSAPQKIKMLYQFLKLPRINFTASGAPSTDKDTLRDLKATEEGKQIEGFLDLLIEYAETSAIVKTPLGLKGSSILHNIDEDSYVRCSWNLTGTETGRASANSPNLTNPARKGGIRELFQAPEGYEWLEADYSQAELRFAAYDSGELNMINAFESGYDGHQAAAAAIYEIPLEEVTDEQRSVGKTVNFLVQYGGGAKRLSQTTGITEQKARTVIKNFYANQPNLKRRMYEIAEKVEKEGLLTNVYGRIRHFNPVFTDDALAKQKREGVNSGPQSAIADTLWRAMYLIDEEFTKRGLKSFLVIALHDGLYILVKTEELEEVREIVEWACSIPIPGIDVSLPVDIEVSKGWKSKG